MLARLIAAVLLVGGLYLGILEAQRGDFLAEGSDAPAFALERYAGGAVSLEGLKGKVVMLDFWATWCAPCMKEMPSLVRLAREYEGRGIAFVAANRDDPEEARAVVDDYVRGRLPDVGPFVAFADDATAVSYRVRSLPTLYFLGRDGKVLFADSGVASEATLRRWIERALESR